MPNYRIDFFELTVDATPEYANAFAAMRELCTRPEPPFVELGGVTRDFRMQDGTVAVRGAFRKFRMNDLPEVGSIGGGTHELELEDDEGLVEKNYFALYRQHSLLLWHTNGHGSSPGQFRRALSDVLGVRVHLNPLIQAGAMQRLMRGDVTLKKVEVSLPRPKDPNYYPDNNFSRSLLAALGAADGDRIRVTISSDARLHQNPKLAHTVKRALKEMVEDETASVAKAHVFEDGIEHPIDLIADRLTSTQEIDHDGRYPSANGMFEAFDNAKQEERDAIQACLGAPGRPVR